jgi:large subunit ribosomal protein L4
LDELKLSGPKTKEIAGLLRNLSGGQSALILLPERIESIEKSVRNLVEFKTVRAQYVNVRDLLQFERLILPLQAVGMLQTILDPGAKSE